MGNYELRSSVVGDDFHVLVGNYFSILWLPGNCLECAGWRILLCDECGHFSPDSDLFSYLRDYGV